MSFTYPPRRPAVKIPATLISWAQQVQGSAALETLEGHLIEGLNPNTGPMSFPWAKNGGRAVYIYICIYICNGM